MGNGWNRVAGAGAHLMHGELEAGEHAVEVELLDGQLATSSAKHVHV